MLCIYIYINNEYLTVVATALVCNTKQLSKKVENVFEGAFYAVDYTSGLMTFNIFKSVVMDGYYRNVGLIMTFLLA